MGRDAARAGNERELVECLVGFYEEKIHRQVRDCLRDGVPVPELLVLVGSTECCGDYVDCLARGSQADVTVDYPMIGRAIAEDRGEGRVPVFVLTECYGGLFWLSVEEDGTIRIDRHATLVAEAISLVDPDETARFCRAGLPDPPPTRWPGNEGTLDRLVTLTVAELDAEIMRAGFDPAAERSGGAGLRASVVAAIGDLAIAHRTAANP